MPRLCRECAGWKQCNKLSSPHGRLLTGTQSRPNTQYDLPRWVDLRSSIIWQTRYQWLEKTRAGISPQQSQIDRRVSLDARAVVLAHSGFHQSILKLFSRNE